MPQYFYTGSRKAQILHTRLPTNCSLDLFMKNITDSPLCSCGSVEDAEHFFFHCHKYLAQRNEVLNSISLTLSSLTRRVNTSCRNNQNKL